MKKAVMPSILVVDVRPLGIRKEGERMTTAADLFVADRLAQGRFLSRRAES